MASKIKITYVAPVAPVTSKAQICKIYDVAEGEIGGSTLAEFMDSQVAHPGVVAALRAAIADESGEYEFIGTEDDVLYFGEIAPAIKDQGFTIAVTPVTDGE